MQRRSITDRFDSLAARDRALLWHPYSPMPGASALPVKSASGTRLKLADGRVLVDAMSSWWAAIHGYGHPKLDDAVRKQLKMTSHVMFGGLTHQPAIGLAEILMEIVPDGLEHVFLSDSGSVAVEVAMKMALQYALGTGHKERTRFLTVRGGYHGDTFGAMSVCDPISGMHSMFTNVLAKQLFAPLPRPKFGETFDKSCVAEFAKILKNNSEQIAAVILEPIVQGAGGMRFYAAEYLKEVRRLCTQHNIILIADEIATGFGRSGKLFACEHAQITPDIICLGKALTGGYISMAATLCTSEVADGIGKTPSEALMHGPTFMGNPLAAAVATESIRLLLSRDWQNEVATIETTLRDGLSPALNFSGVADVRVLGGIGVIETHDQIPVAETQKISVDRGVWLRPFGKLLYTMPPYISTETDLLMITDTMTAAAKALT